MKYRFILPWAIVLLSLTAYSPAHSQATHLPAGSDQIVFSAPPPPPVGAPDGRSRGGASRGECRDYESLTALVPTVNGKVWGTTGSEHPTFWFYFPKAVPADTSVAFVLQDANHIPLYATTLNLNIEAGLNHLTVPKTVPAMLVGQPYSWALAVYCDPEDPGEFVSVNGTIERVAIDPAQQARLAADSPLDQVKWYAAQGIWYDALNTLSEPYEDDSRNSALATAWANLLKYANLEYLTTQPIRHCCRPRS
ncbi:MAG TPA: DUF928 domain-containing protein [Coleofasciculaceae cyanobacterium]